MSQDPPEWLGYASSLSVQCLLRVGAEHLVGDRFPIGSTCGLPYVLVPVDSEAALDELQIDVGGSPNDFQSQCALPNGLALYFYFRRTASASEQPTCRTRMFCHESGMWVEDAATGSAAGPLACHLAPLTNAIFIQGSSRRAIICVRSWLREGARVEVGGSVAEIARGSWAVGAFMA